MIYLFDDFEFDDRRWELRERGALLEAPPKVMQTIAVLLLHRDRVVSNEELRAELWPEVTVTDVSIRKSIRLARQLLGGGSDAERYIRTTRGRGYRFVAEVREESRRISAPPPATSEASRAAKNYTAPFVGRDAELAELHAGINQALAGRGSLVLVTGDPGMGKSRLVEALATAAERRGACVRWGRCCEEGGAPELRPWTQIVRSLLDLEGAGVQAGATLREMERLLPVSNAADQADGSPAFPSESDRFRLFDAIGRFLRRLAADQPMVLILEDLHSADAASLLLARFLVRETTDTGLMVVGTYRPAEVGSEALTKLLREARTLVLNGFSEEGTRRLIEATLETTPDGDLVRRVQSVTEGNPFFISEIIRLTATADRRTTDHPLLEGLQVPHQIMEIVRGRFDAVPPTTRDLLSIASVIGREFAIPLLQKVSGRTREEVTLLLEPARERKIVAAQSGTPGSCRFTHMLFRDVLYEELGITRRADVHRSVGEALESICSKGEDAPSALLAHHFSRAALGGPSDKAVVHSIAAGRRALHLLAFEEAVLHFERALEALRFESNQEARRSDILLSLGHARRLTGDYTRAGETFFQSLAIAESLADPIRAGRAALGFAQVKPESGVQVNVQLIQVLERVVTLLDTATPETEARELLGLTLARLATCFVLARRRDDAEALSRRASDLARAAGRPHALAHALLSRHWVLWRPGTAEERLAIASELVGLDGSLGDAQLRQDACVCRITDLLELGRRHALDLAISEHEKLALVSREPLSLWNVRVYGAMKAILEGRLEQGETLAHEALPIGVRIHSKNAHMAHGAHLWWIRIEQDRAAELEPVFRIWVENFPSNDSLRCLLLRLYTEMGARREALQEFERLARDDFSGLAEDWTLLPTLAHLAAASEFLGDATRAAMIDERLSPYDKSHVVLGPALLYLGPVSLYRGLCASAMSRFDEAIAWFEDAALESQRLGAQLMVARAERHRDRALARRREANPTRPSLGAI